MKKIYTKNLFLINTLILLATIVLIPFSSVYAYITPNLTVNSSDNGYTQVTVNGDPNSVVKLYYNGTYNTLNSDNIGYTNNNGYFFTSILNSDYNIIPSSYVYVMINGVNSQNVLWPAYYNNNYSYNSSNYNNYNNNYLYTNPSYINPITFSQNNVNLTSGQNTYINIYGGSNYYVYGNTNPYNVSASVTGNILNIYANSAGNSVITVCQYNLASCANVNVAVINNNYQQGNTYRKITNHHYKLPFHFSFNFMNRFTR